MAPTASSGADTLGQPPLSVERAGEIVGALGLPANPSVDDDGLHAVYSAWCRSIPFDNLQKLLALNAGDSVLPGMVADDFFTAWQADGTGGTCWASNNGLHALLTVLGFDAEVWSASMFDGPANHGTTVVTIVDQRWLVDTAIHGDVPAPIIHGKVSEVEHHGYPTTIRHDDKGCIVEHPTPDPDFVIPCRLLETITYRDTVQANERSRGWSPFNTGLMAAINDHDGVWMLNGDALTRIDQSGRSTRTVTIDEADHFLIEVARVSPRIVERVRATMS